MRTDNTMIYLIAAVIIGHFVIGIAWLLYKILSGDKKKDEKMETDQ